MKQISWISPVLIFSLLLAAGCQPPADDPAEPPSVTILQTGQTASIETEDDGYLQMGLDWPAPRFTDNGDNTVTDNLTGLMWEQCPGNSTMDWAAALVYANGLDLATHDDWRLPNINELESLCSSQESLNGTWLSSLELTDVQNNVYWSSTTDAAATANAWYVDMSNTRLNSIDKSTDTVYVWAVRGITDKLMKTGQTTSYTAGDDGDLEQGVAWPSPRFADLGDGTIRDNLTGLIWQKAVDTTARNWAASFTYARGLSFASADDWRIPNKRELRSLIHYGVSNQVTCLAGFGFTDFDSEYYWTSTIYAQSTSKAFACSLTGATAGQEPGCLLNHERTSSACTVLVRGGE